MATIQVCLFLLFFAAITPVANALEDKTMGIDEIITCANHDQDCEESTSSQYGELSIKTIGDTNFKLFFNKKEVGEFEGLTLSIQEQFTIGKKDIFLIAVNSGGMACPMEMYVFEIGDALNYKLSKAFGTCSDLYRTSMEKEALTITMPYYFNPMHINDLTPKQQKTLKKTKDVMTYIWSNSELIEKK